MSMQFTVTDHGDLKRLTQKFELLRHNALHAKPAMQRILADMRLVEKEVFGEQGARGGNKRWRRLKPGTVERKGSVEILRTYNAKPRYSSIGQDALYRSLVVGNAKYRVARATNFSAEFGTTRPYAIVHQTGSRSRNIPARPFLQFTSQDEERWVTTIEAWLIHGFGNER